MLQHLYDLIRPYGPVLLVAVVYPLVTAALNWLLWWDTPERWDAFAAAHPQLATAVRVLRALSPHLRKVAVVWRDVARARSAPAALPAVDALAHHRTTEPGPPPPSQPGHAALGALWMLWMLWMLALVASLVTGCPRLPPVSGCQPEAQTCIADAPHVCSASQRWHRAGDLDCRAVGGACVVEGGRAFCAPMADGGAR